MSEEKIEVAVPETEEKTENVMETIVHDPNAQIITLKKLLEAGVHYGHQTKKWNPKMKPFIYCPRNGILIIDLNKSKEGLEASYLKLKEIVEEGGKVLFVGTKDQTKEIIEEQALRSGSFYITNRWLGGILTNFKTIQTRIRKLKELEASELEGAWATLPKKEAAALRKEKEKLSKNLEGIKEMRKIPNALVVVDPTSEYNAVREANKLNIPVFALCDTNCNPDPIDYVIPANDDAQKSVALIITTLADAVVEAKGGLPEVAYTKDEGDEVTMKDAIRQADRENALRLAARRELQREKLEREKERRARFEKPENKVEGEAKKEEAPKAE
ncbi:MAG: 30S ribosomal protein S2 [Mollicutes bacterium]|nr:30S ribosomal protein S2 [Mollicutes bacterium]MDD7264556.1 30S ribosomal protein S2 [bacterium]